MYNIRDTCIYVLSREAQMDKMDVWILIKLECQTILAYALLYNSELWKIIIFIFRICGWFCNESNI